MPNPSFEKATPPPLPKRAERAPQEKREKMENIATLMGRATEASPEHPDRNEDNHVYSKERGVFGVFDGMGGVPAGEVASSVAGTLLSRRGLESLDGSPDEELCKKVFGSETGVALKKEEVEAAAAAMMRKMNSYAELLGQLPGVRARAVKMFNEQLGAQVGEFDESNDGHQRIMEKLLQNVGTTASFGKLWKDAEGKRHLTVAQVGDSRIYRLRGGTQLERLTKDDSHVQILLEAGLIRNDEDVSQTVPHDEIISRAVVDKRLKPLVDKLKRLPDPAPISAFRNVVTQGIGLATLSKEMYGIEFQPQVKTYDVQDGDIFAAVTDGICDNLEDEELVPALNAYRNNPERAAKQMVSQAGEVSRDKGNARSKTDDLTAVVIAIE